MARFLVASLLSLALLARGCEGWLSPPPLLRALPFTSKTGQDAFSLRQPTRRVCSMAVGVPGNGNSQASEFVIPAGCEKLRVGKPLGVVLEEVREGKGAVVVSVKEGSNADKSGVRVGDEVVACSATTLKAGKDGAYERTGYGGRPFDNWDIIMFPCEDQPFEAIMAAIASNNERWGITSVTLVVRRNDQEN
eukprot:751704-Hanusia_phi.AAC.5